MMDLKKYNPVCECGWRLVDDVFYQVKEGIVYELEYNVPTRKPIPKFSDLKVYPEYTMLDEEKNTWVERHFCPKCEKEYDYEIPMEEE
jgi:hypothetical protein